jgi:hypothetical protein
MPSIPSGEGFECLESACAVVRAGAFLSEENLIAGPIDLWYTQPKPHSSGGTP